MISARPVYRIITMEWLRLTAKDVCERYRRQKATGTHVVEDALLR